MSDIKEAYFNQDSLSVELPKPSAVIHIGSFHINLYDKKFTQQQIKNMNEYFGWEVENIKEE